MAKSIIARKIIDLFAVCGSYTNELFAGMQKSFEKPSYHKRIFVVNYSCPNINSETLLNAVKKTLDYR